MAGRIARVDAARQQAYVGSMRRSVRPVFFPAPSLERRPLAERFLCDATQKGVLDFPALSNVDHSESDHAWNRNSRSRRDAALCLRVSLDWSVARPRYWSSRWH